MNSSSSFPTGWNGLARRVGRIFILIQIPGIAIALLGVFLAGWWDFRASMQDLLIQEWVELNQAQEGFEFQLRQIDDILYGTPPPNAGSEYGAAALSYIHSIEAITYSIPEAADETADLYEAIGGLRKYFDEKDPPAPQSEAWTIFYGEFRSDLNRYVIAKQLYFDAIKKELSSYVRHAIDL